MKHLTLTIPDPCSENWDTFTPATQGRFCSSCNKVIVDFTRMSDEAIIDFFSNKPAHTCGRFRADQMKTYSRTPLASVNPGYKLFKVGLLSLVLLLISKPNFAQAPREKATSAYVQNPVDTLGNAAVEDKYVVKGVITDEDGNPMAGANVILKGYPIGTSADGEGRFEFPQKLKAGDVLIFTFIGFRTQEYQIPKAANGELKIQLEMEMEVTLGAVAVDMAYQRPSALSTWWSKVKSLF